MTRHDIEFFCRAISNSGVPLRHYIFKRDEACDHQAEEAKQIFSHLCNLPLPDLSRLGSILSNFEHERPELRLWGANSGCALCDFLKGLAASHRAS